MKKFTNKHVFMIAAFVLLCIFIPLALFTSCADLYVESTPFSSTVILTNFTYTGANTVHFCISRGRSDQEPINLGSIDSAILLAGTSTTQTGTFDITVAEITIPNLEGSSADEGLDVWLFIASDDDSSGDLSLGDRLMPVFSLNLPNGETVEIDGLTLDFGVPSASWTYDFNSRIRVDVNFSVPAVVDAGHPLVFRMDNANNNDFSLAPNHRYIEITDPRLVGPMYVYLPDVTDDYFLAMVFDRDGDGNVNADPGDNTSELNWTAIPNGINVTAGNPINETRGITIDSYTVFP